jgi:hypothetical protein
MEPTVTAVTAGLPETAVGLRVHLTRLAAEETKGSDTTTSVDILRGRPILGDIVRDAHRSASKVAIVGASLSFSYSFQFHPGLHLSFTSVWTRRVFVRCP